MLENRLLRPAKNLKASEERVALIPSSTKEGSHYHEFQVPASRRICVSPNCPLPLARCPLPTAYCLLPTAHCLLLSPASGIFT